MKTYRNFVGGSISGITVLALLLAVVHAGASAFASQQYVTPHLPSGDQVLSQVVQSNAQKLEALTSVLAITRTPSRFVPGRHGAVLFHVVSLRGVQQLVTPNVPVLPLLSPSRTSIVPRVPSLPVPTQPRQDFVMPIPHRNNPVLPVILTPPPVFVQHHPPVDEPKQHQPPPAIQNPKDNPKDNPNLKDKPNENPKDNPRDKQKKDGNETQKQDPGESHGSATSHGVQPDSPSSHSDGRGGKDPSSAHSDPKSTTDANGNGHSKK